MFSRSIENEGTCFINLFETAAFCTTIVLLYNYCIAVQLLYCCTTIVLLYNYCIAVQLLYCCTTIVLLYNYCIAVQHGNASVSLKHCLHFFFLSKNQGPFLELVLIEQLKHFSLAKFSCHFLLHVVRECNPL